MKPKSPSAFISAQWDFYAVAGVNIAICGCPKSSLVQGEQEQGIAIMQVLLLRVTSIDQHVFFSMGFDVVLFLVGSVMG
ncbi:hypothetical protein EYC80_005865 [Monilinia laxa]|uniref:Uncharacterized protein n=1 Tax=Monilinia laxa TaxID=61186 RepID=A0A5N6KFJ4_MONLA|nr:hypothetical protein EYC80_005865 [Monilinia laxa]